MIRVNISLANATVTETETLTAGRVGLECAFTFSSEWDGLSKVAVFEGAETIEVALGTASVAVVPPECMATAGYNLRVGAYGLSAANAIVIPTIWAKAGKIKDSAAPDDESFAPATPELVAQIMQASQDAISIARQVSQQAASGAFDGEDGFSPTIETEGIDGGTQVTVTDVNGTQSFTVMDGTDGEDGEGVPTGGTTGQILRKNSGADYDAGWSDLPKDVVWATYGTTTSAELEAAYQAKKEVLCEYGDMIYALRYRGNSTTHTFVAYMNSSGYYVRCSSDVWANGSISLAPLNSPTLTGTPKAPTASAGTDTTQIATTAFVQGELDGVHQVPAGGSSGYVLKKASGTDYDLEWAAESGGGGTTEVFWASYNSSTYAEVGTAYMSGKLVGCVYNNNTYYLTQFDTFNAVYTFACVDGSARFLYVYSDNGWASDSASIGTYSKPSGGIPATDLASAVQTSLGKADTALQSYTETDPTVPSWAKAASKPNYTASEVGLGNVDNVQQYSANNPPPYPVTSVNGQTGTVSLSIPSSAADVGAIASNQGVANAGKFMVVGSDGVVAPVTMAAWSGGSY